jgi:hypothetical protein
MQPTEHQNRQASTPQSTHVQYQSATQSLGNPAHNMQGHTQYQILTQSLGRRHTNPMTQRFKLYTSDNNTRCLLG